MSAPFLRFRKVSVDRGGQRVLTVPDFQVASGAIVVLTGDNGAGKSSLLLAAAGLLDLTEGGIDLFGTPFHEGRAPAPRPLRQRLGIVFQEPYLFSKSVLANLVYALKLHRVPKADREGRARKTLERLHLADFAERRATELSSGERKQVALARALVLEPEGLLLDEVTASLDEQAREIVLEAIRNEVTERGVSVLMATHLQDLAGRLSAQTVTIRAGNLSSSD
jgi:tungstate transport system ATP-binding protein